MKPLNQGIAFLLTMLFLFPAVLGLAEGGLSSGISSEELYSQMTDNFNNRWYEKAWNQAEALYQADRNYKDIGLYYFYLRAIQVYIPGGEYQKAYDDLTVLSFSGFEKSEGYAHYAEGLIYETETRDYDRAREAYSEAAKLGIIEATNRMLSLPAAGGETIRVTETNKTETTLSLAWTDDAESSSYTVLWSPKGMDTLAQSASVQEKATTLTDLLPNTDYAITVKADGANRIGQLVCYTTQAEPVNVLNVSNPRIKLDGDSIPVTVKTGTRRPADLGKKYRLRMTATIDILKTDRTVTMTWVAHLEGQTCSTERKAAINANESWLSVECDLTECLKLFDENHASYAGKMLSVDIYIDGNYLTTQSVVVFEE